mmetsp:Transcript_42055/g.107530  ORF Transcript_42055/g.107530 Transcript_42055/m.107530 type:complete len:286 (+) Transcript_42055:1309-2166(+)
MGGRRVGQGSQWRRREALKAAQRSGCCALPGGGAIRERWGAEGAREQQHAPEVREAQQQHAAPAQQRPVHGQDQVLQRGDGWLERRAAGGGDPALLGAGGGLGGAQVGDDYLQREGCPRRAGGHLRRRLKERVAPRWVAGFAASPRLHGRTDLAGLPGRAGPARARLRHVAGSRGGRGGQHHRSDGRCGGSRLQRRRAVAPVRGACDEHHPVAHGAGGVHGHDGPRWVQRGTCLRRCAGRCWRRPFMLVGAKLQVGEGDFGAIDCQQPEATLVLPRRSLQLHHGK